MDFWEKRFKMDKVDESLVNEAPIKYSKYDTNQLRNLAELLGLDKKKLYGTSKDAIIRAITDVTTKSKSPITYSVMQEVEVGDNSKDRMEIDTFKGTLNDIVKAYLSGSLGKILKVDNAKKEIIVENVERKVIEALIPVGPENSTPFKEGQSLTLKKDVYYGFLDNLFDYFECNPNVAEAVREFTSHAKPVIMRNSVMFVIPKGTRIELEIFYPGRDDVFARVWGVLIPLTFFPDKNKGEIYWDDAEVWDWVK
jgi:hypothetical protein